MNSFPVNIKSYHDKTAFTMAAASSCKPTPHLCGTTFHVHRHRLLSLNSNWSEISVRRNCACLWGWDIGRCLTECLCKKTGRWLRDTHILCRTHQPQCGSPELRHSPQVPYCSHDSMGTWATWKHMKRSGSQCCMMHTRCTTRSSRYSTVYVCLCVRTEGMLIKSQTPTDDISNIHRPHILNKTNFFIHWQWLNMTIPSRNYTWSLPMYAFQQH